MVHISVFHTILLWYVFQGEDTIVIYELLLEGILLSNTVFTYYNQYVSIIISFEKITGRDVIGSVIFLLIRFSWCGFYLENINLFFLYCGDLILKINTA